MKRILVMAALVLTAGSPVPAEGQDAGDCDPTSSPIEVTSEGNEFDTDCIAVKAEQAVEIELTNEDAFAHNISIYESPAASDSLFVGEYVRGTESITYDVPALDTGRYFFRCDIHPTMTGAFLSYDGDGELPPAEESDGGAVGRAPAGAAVELETVVTGLTAPVFITHAPGDEDRIFVVDQPGQVRIIKDGALVEDPFLDLSDKIVELDPKYDERGLLGLAFHPDYASNGRFIAYYSRPLRDDAPKGFDHTGTFSEFRVSDDPDRADPGSERVILQIDKPQRNHNGGHIAFGPDGYLYIPMGDGGMANDEGLGHAPDGNAQQIDTMLGKVLRIDVDGRRPYAVPDDNPFLGEGTEEIYALGFRNPYHLSFDAGGDHEMWVADAGQDRFEEASIVTQGGNYGWRLKEGTHCFDPESPSRPPGSCPDESERGEDLIDPVLEYSREEIFGSVIVGGYVYRGDSMPELRGRYIFGDYSRDRLKPQGVLFAASEGDPLWHIRELQPTLNGKKSKDGSVGRFVLSFGEDANRELYVGLIEEGGPTGMTGAVYRFVSADGANGGGDGEEGSTAAERSTPGWLFAVLGLLTLVALALGVSLFRPRRA